MNVVLRHLDVEDYVSTLEAMRRFTKTRDADTPDELWLLQHQSVFTQGQAGKPEHILDPHGIPVVQSDRGGQVTYHGPGQLVVYFLLDVRRRNYGVRALVDIIESSLLDVLRSFGLNGELRKGAPGVYVDGGKIAALGLRISKGCSLHGLSFNIDMDLEPFKWINPCGYEGLGVTQLADLLDRPRAGLFEESRARLVESLQSRLL
jgi:lipoyl(octanoyl) transferase